MFYEYAGSIHCHSRYSDGSGTIEEIINKATSAKLDFVILTDHDTLAPLFDGYEAWHDELLLLVGQEISPKSGCHYLAFNLDKEIQGKERTDYQNLIDEVNESGGFGFIAHPYGAKKPPLLIQQGHLWTDWQVERYCGIEIWSYMVDWVNNVNFFTLIYYQIFPEKAIKGPSSKALKKWDEIAQKRHIVGIGSTDAHALSLPFLRFIKFLPYEYLYRTIRTHVLLNEPLSKSSLHEDKRKIYAALKAGNCFIAHDIIADSSGFLFSGATKDSGDLIMGQETKFNHMVELCVSVPYQAEIQLLRNGETIKNINAKKLHISTDKSGVYRVEVYLDGRPWIFSNPIFLRNS